MEYIFGTSTRDGMTVENLKTVGEQHTNLSGFHMTVQKFQDGSEATDRFRVLEHYHSAESGGKMYDWYTIDSHTRSEKGALNREAAAAVRLAMMQAQSLPDAQALEVPELYPGWEPGADYAAQYIVSRPNGRLYRCQQGHASQEGWEPENAPALWTVIANGETGSRDDPITAARGMEYQYGLYYRDPEDGNTYLCSRIGEAEGGKIVLQYLPHELVGQYFTEVSAGA